MKYYLSDLTFDPRSNLTTGTYCLYIYIYDYGLLLWFFMLRATKIAIGITLPIAIKSKQ